MTEPNSAIDSLKTHKEPSKILMLLHILLIGITGYFYCNIVPIFSDMYEKMGVADIAPLNTRIVIAAGKSLSGCGDVFLIIVVGLFMGFITMTIVRKIANPALQNKMAPNPYNKFLDHLNLYSIFLWIAILIFSMISLKFQMYDSKL